MVPLYNFKTYKWLFSFAKCRDNQHEKLAYFLVVGDKWLNLTTVCTMAIQDIEFSSGVYKVGKKLLNIKIPKGILRIGVVANFQKLGIIIENKGIKMCY